jgi:ATP diphosphatase
MESPGERGFRVSGDSGETDRVRELLAIMARLRAPNGCPWDREQTFASIAPYTVEEAYEVADAIARGDMRHLKDELGDLLFQVVFHAQMAQEANHFDFQAVAGAICDKLRRRHPHVFGAARPLTAAEQTAAWEDIKADERRAGGRGADAGASDSHLDGVPQALPALMRAYKLSKRAARVGFDWEHWSQTADKVAEELEEVRAAAANAEAQGQVAESREIFEEIGDLLFAVANLARKLGVDAEAALRSANAKFERRFRGMESLAAQRGQVFADLQLESQEGLWLEVKRGE